MVRFYASKFVNIILLFSRVEEMFKAVDDDNKQVNLLSKTRVTSWLNEARAMCEEIGLPMSIMQIDKMKREINFNNPNPQILRTVFAELNSRFSDEMSIPVFLVMKPDRIDYYQKPNVFGDQVFDNFPSANFDIEEAGKCFAAARYTACVMHLQRVIEVALKAYVFY